jgi:hypothetical protein
MLSARAGSILPGARDYGLRYAPSLTPLQRRLSFAAFSCLRPRQDEWCSYYLQLNRIRHEDHVLHFQGGSGPRPILLFGNDI